MELTKWKIVKLGDVSQFVNGGAWNQSEYRNSGIPVVRVTNIQNYSVNLKDAKYLPHESLVKYQKHRLREGDMVVCTVGSHPDQPSSVVGRTAIIPNSAAGSLLNQNAVQISSNSPTLEQKWLVYFGRSAQFGNFIMANARGSASQVRISIERLKDLKFLLPPLPIQKKIASILSAYDDLIENNNRRIQILEEMAQRIYREWFVHFRFPGHENVKMVDSELGKIPEGWEVLLFSEAADFLNGFALSPTHWGEEGKPIVKIKELKNGITGETPRNTGLEIDKKYLINKGDLIFSWSGDLGVYLWNNEQAILNQHLFKVTLKTTLISIEYLFYTLKESIKIFESMTTGSTLKHIRRSELSNVRLSIPHNDLLTQFTSISSKLLLEIQILYQQNQALRKTRDLLLPRLISGRLDVEDLDIEV